MKLKKGANSINKKLYQALFNISSSAAWEWDLRTKEFRTNAEWRAFSGKHAPEKLCLEEFFEIFYPFQDEERKRDNFRLFLESDKSYYRDRCSIKGKDGKIVQAHNSVFLLRGRNGKPQVMVGSVCRQPIFEYVRSYDGLTMLPNRDSLLSIVKEEISESSRRLSQSAFLIIDMNNFSQINNVFGYSNGDDVLRQIGRRLATLNFGNVLVSRGESNNFVMFISDMDHVDEVDMLVNKIYSLFKEPFRINNAGVILTVCIGATQFYSGESKLDEIIHSTFVALMRAKSESHNENRYVLFNQSMLVDTRQREKIISSLEGFRENGSLRLFYQPQFYAQTDKLHAFEALLRLDVDEVGAVSPSKFIPIAEETGQIVDIGYWVIEESCEAVKRFREAGLEFTSVAVNVSLVQLISPGFISRVKEIIKNSGVSPSCLEFEITESVLMSSVEHGADILRQLKEFGVNIVLDDFGSGYSSLNYIRALSIDTLKIDKVFIDGICRDDKSKYIVEMVLNLAKQLGLEVVAEGVETREQLEVLRGLSCPVIQGYFYSRPLPEKRILEKFAGISRPA